MSDKVKCGGLIVRRGLCMLEIMGYEWRAGRSSRILAMFGENEIPLCYLSLGKCADGSKQLVLCVEHKMRERCRPILDGVRDEFMPRALGVVEDVVILTVYGPHFYERVALASEVYGSTCEAGIDAHSVGSSVNSISLVVDAADEPGTIASLRTRFVWPE
ncbi:hypothetical protein KKG45_12790 [bacterium]|nr:hypothetical protein [bacterium]MBU1074116.1 hypothetical protein [bacterium]MBU1676470.1 hypothetical protein [bacterium]